MSCSSHSSHSSRSFRLGSSRARLGISDSPRARLGLLSGSSRVRLGIVSESSRNHIGLFSGSSRARLGLVSDSLRGRWRGGLSQLRLVSGSSRAHLITEWSLTRFGIVVLVSLIHIEHRRQTHHRLHDLSCIHIYIYMYNDMHLSVRQDSHVDYK